jgi:hypothetical protein
MLLLLLIGPNAPALAIWMLCDPKNRPSIPGEQLNGARSVPAAFRLSIKTLAPQRLKFRVGIVSSAWRKIIFDTPSIP